MVSQSELHAVWSSSELKGGLPVNAFGSCAGQKIFCLFERAIRDQTDRRFRDSPPDAACDHCEWRPFPLPGGTHPEAPDVRPHGRRFLSHCCATTWYARLTDRISARPPQPAGQIASEIADSGVFDANISRARP